VPALEHKLKEVFGYDTFRPHQREIADAFLAGRDTLAVLPTGAGKSLCYQLPPLHLNQVAMSEEMKALIPILAERRARKGPRSRTRTQNTPRRLGLHITCK